MNMRDIWKAFRYGVGAMLGISVVSAMFSLFDPIDEADFLADDES